MARTDVVIIGAGLAGLTSAWYLRRAGLSVRVLEREADVGLATSFANGGMLTPSMSDPWNAPGVQWKLLRWLLRADAPIKLRPAALHHYLGWGLRFLHHSAPARHRAAMQANYRLSRYSIEQLRELRKTLPLDYAAGTRGTMKVFRDPWQLEEIHGLYSSLRDEGLIFETVDAAGAARIEPLLAESMATIAGGLYFPGDEIGNAYLFCQSLKSQLRTDGISFSFDTAADRILMRNGRVCGVRAGDEEIEAENVVVAAAAWSSALLQPLGVEVNIRPVKGYSVSIEFAQPARFPVIALVDDHLHTAITPLGNTLRLAGTAEFGGWDRHLDPARIRSLWNFLATLSPALAAEADQQPAREWCGFRPMSADGRPYIGATGVAGLYLNTGHGHLGWTQAAGSGRLLSQLLKGVKPEIDPMPYSLRRE